MTEDLKLVDVIVEILDARVPEASRNPDIIRLGAGKKRILLLNKADLADPKITADWKASYEAQGYDVLTPDARSTAAVKEIRALLEKAAREKHEKDLKRGIKNRPTRIMVAGIPNVGKSTLINSLAGRASAKTGDKPGVTKGSQWIRLSGSLELMDTPGILWPKFEDDTVALHLALVGSISEEVLNKTELAVSGLKLMAELYPQLLKDRYGFTADDPYAQLDELAVLWHMVKKGGEADIDRAASQFLDELRKGKLGRLSFEKPQPAEVQA